MKKEKHHRKLLVLDIDETLVHCNYYLVNEKIKTDFMIDENSHRPIFGWKRPYLDKFLNEIPSSFDIAVWSSGSQDYVDEIVKILFKDKDKKPLFSWSRDRCTRRYFFDGIYSYNQQSVDVKRLQKIRRTFGYDLKNILMVDDSPEKLMDNYGNLIKIKPFEVKQHYDGDDILLDDKLIKLLNYLNSIENHTNYRNLDKKNWENCIIQRKNKI